MTEARWIAEELAELRPDAHCSHVPNGIDKDLFDPPDASPGRDDGPLRVLVEGSPQLWFKGVAEAVEVLRSDPGAAPRHARDAGAADPGDPRRLRRRRRARWRTRRCPPAYRRADVLLKLSRVEGVFTPPIEAFHLGATAVVWPVTGHDEYVEHGVNGIVAGWDDVAGTARWLDLLATDAELLGRLRRGALDTARSWPSWEQADRPDGDSALGRSPRRPNRPAAPAFPSSSATCTRAWRSSAWSSFAVAASWSDRTRSSPRSAAGRAVAQQRAARAEQGLASTLGARARRLLASRRR